MRFYNRYPLSVLSATLLLLLCTYLLIRSPAGRYSDYLWTETRWNVLWRRVAEIPRRIEPTLIRLGLLPSGLLETQLRGGVKFLLDPNDYVDRRIIANGEWEPIEWSWIEKVLAPGDVFVDVGAHHGSYSIKAARAVSDAGLVVAVEPNPLSVERLKRNIALNQLRNIKILEVACGERRSSSVLFTASDLNTGMTSLSAETASRSGPGGAAKKFEVRVERLDDLLEELQDRKIAVLKVDTEGAETMVLRGAAETIRKHHPAIVVETVESQLLSLGSSLAELESLLRSFGCKKAQSTPNNALWACGQR